MRDAFDLEFLRRAETSNVRDFNSSLPPIHRPPREKLLPAGCAGHIRPQGALQHGDGAKQAALEAQQFRTYRRGAFYSAIKFHDFLNLATDY